MNKSDFEQERLLQHIKTSGLLDSFVDPYGNTQGATPSTSSALNVESVPDNSRFVTVALTGNGQINDGSIGFEQYPCTVSVFGKKDPYDMEIVRGLSVQLSKWLKKNFQNAEQCIFGIQVLGSGNGGPYFAEEGRVYFDIPLIVKFYEVG